MGRAPCCEKMGLKRGPWTAEEDRILAAHIEQHGHSNWRALPKQAGLLRCGKSCRLRWINYLRPDVKRGNFTREEEDAIIHLHDLLGNRWSLIAARLPGRTDNEIKNVWHTHLKKRLEAKQSGQAQGTTSAPKRKAKKPVASVRTLQGQTSVPVSPEQSSSRSTTTDYSMASLLENTDNSSLDSEEFQIDDSFWSETLAMTVDSSGSGMAQGTTSTPKRKAKKPVAPVSAPEGPTSVPVSPEQSLSTSSATDYSVASSLENADSFTSQEFQIDDRFWSETLGMTVDSFGSGMETGVPFGVDGASPASSNDGMDFWVRLFMQASDMQNFSQI